MGCASVFDAKLNNFNSCKRRGAAYTVEESPNGSARYCYDYSDNELSQFIPIIKAADREGKKVQVYFNNHPNGSGAKNAISLKKMIEMLSLASL